MTLISRDVCEHSITINRTFEIIYDEYIKIIMLELLAS